MKKLYALIFIILFCISSKTFCQNNFTILRQPIPTSQFLNWVKNEHLQDPNIQLILDDNYLGSDLIFPENINVIRYQRKYKGYPVESQGILSFVNNNNAVGIYDNMSLIGKPDLTVNITEEEAFLTASGHNHLPPDRIFGNLVIVSDKIQDYNGFSKLAYKFSFLNKISFIDAKSGILIAEFNKAGEDGGDVVCPFSSQECGGGPTGVPLPPYDLSELELVPKKINVHTLYDGQKEITVGYDENTNTYYLINVFDGKDIRSGIIENYNWVNIQAIEFKSYNNDPTNPDSFPTDFQHLQAFQAFWAANTAWDYFENTHQLPGFGGLKETLAVFTMKGADDTNAFFGFGSAPSGQIFLGDGNNIDHNSLTDLTIVGHEYAHGTISVFSGITGKNESGSLNEGFADVFGATINFNEGINPTYRLGQNVKISGFRDLQNPKILGHPDCYRGKKWEYPTSNPNDFDTHINGTVLGHWFYLASEGKNYRNDFGYSYNVHGLGRERIVEHALATITLTPSYANYFDVKTVSNGLCQLVVAINPTPENIELKETIEEAWKAVGVVGSPYKYYCNSSGNQFGDTGIGTIDIGANNIQITNSSNEGYVNKLEDATVYLNTGETHTVNLNAIDPNASNLFWRIWLDYNNDGDFDDSGELVTQGTTFNSLFIGNFTVPTNTEKRFTRMRIAKSENGAPVPCGTIGRGQVIDLTVRFTDGTFTSNIANNSKEKGSLPNRFLNDKMNTITVFPNPSNGEIKITTNSLKNIQYIDLLNINGKLVKRFTTSNSNKEIRISGLQKGLYILKISLKDEIITNKILVK